MAKYNRLYLMVGATSLIIYGLMYFNSYSFDHLHFSQVRVYMVAMMASVIMLAMLFFMRTTYRHRVKNFATVGVSLFIFASSFYLVRSQDTVQDVSWMKTTITNHSATILQSEQAELKDPRVRQLAREIIVSHQNEILMMENFIKDLETTPVDDSIYLEDSDTLAE